jgi:pilus assembly protein CpaF
MTTFTLEVRDADQAARSITLDTDGPWWIGRDTECAVVLPSPHVSRRHARLEREASGLRLCDASANGTRVDESWLHDGGVTLTHDACIRIGPYTVRWQRALDPELRKQLHARVLAHMNLDALDPKSMDAERLRPAVEAALCRLCGELGLQAADADARAALVAELCDEVLGLGPLEPLLRDPAVTEIMVVDAASIYVEKHGVIERTPQCFSNDDSVRAVIERIVTPLGRRIDESSPMVDARLPDGSRVNAVIPPLATRGPCLTIRKFGGAPLSVEALVTRGSIDSRLAKFLARAVRVRRNIVVAGGTGSGKTTLLNVLSSIVPNHERIVTIEDAAELRLQQPHVVTLEARTENLEGRGQVGIRDLLRNALRMRPDRILIGECRGGEALDMLQAMNTGHEGTMTTTHANSPREALSRLETLCLMADIELPLRAIRAQLAASVHLVIQQARGADGRRGVTRVSEVVGVDHDGELHVEDVFRRAADGAFEITGYLPRCLDTFIEHGLVDDGEYL